MILVEIKDNKIVTKIKPYYYFSESVDILQKLWTIIFKHVESMPRNMNNQYEYVQIFKLISRKCGQNHEIVDNIVHTFWELV